MHNWGSGLLASQVMDVVELRPLANNLVGVPRGGGSTLSVEQRKRLTIAVEVVANPAVIFMDEPTSGECSASADLARVCPAHESLVPDDTVILL